MSKQIEIVKGTAFELDPDKKYLICIDRSSITINDAQKLMESLKIADGSVALMTNGDPNTAVKIVEE